MSDNRRRRRHLASERPASAAASTLARYGWTVGQAGVWWRDGVERVHARDGLISVHASTITVDEALAFIAIAQEAD